MHTHSLLSCVVRVTFDAAGACCLLDSSGLSSSASLVLASLRAGGSLVLVSPLGASGSPSPAFAMPYSPREFDLRSVSVPPSSLYPLAVSLLQRGRIHTERIR
jgi:threonine dehydrogenase-like Zn-dependent dehydrogenase